MDLDLIIPNPLMFSRAAVLSIEQGRASEKLDRVYIETHAIVSVGLKGGTTVDILLDKM